MEDKEINNSKSATVIKTIYTVLIIVILINCIILIASLVLKSDSFPIVSKHQIIVKENNENTNQFIENEEIINHEDNLFEE